MIRSEVLYISPWALLKDPAKAIWPPSSTVGGNYTSSESIGSDSPANIDAPGLVGEDPEEEAEPPFLLGEPRRPLECVFMHY